MFNYSHFINGHYCFPVWILSNVVVYGKGWRLFISCIFSLYIRAFTEALCLTLPTFPQFWDNCIYTKFPFSDSGNILEFLLVTVLSLLSLLGLFSSYFLVDKSILCGNRNWSVTCLWSSRCLFPYPFKYLVNSWVALRSLVTLNVWMYG